MEENCNIPILASTAVAAVIAIQRPWHFPPWTAEEPHTHAIYTHTSWAVVTLAIRHTPQSPCALQRTYATHVPRAVRHLLTTPRLTQPAASHRRHDVHGNLVSPAISTAATVTAAAMLDPVCASRARLPAATRHISLLQPLPPLRGAHRQPAVPHPRRREAKSADGSRRSPWTAKLFADRCAVVLLGHQLPALRRGAVHLRRALSHQLPERPLYGGHL